MKEEVGEFSDPGLGESMKLKFFSIRKDIDPMFDDIVRFFESDGKKQVKALKEMISKAIEQKILFGLQTNTISYQLVVNNPKFTKRFFTLLESKELTNHEIFRLLAEASGTKKLTSKLQREALRSLGVDIFVKWTTQNDYGISMTRDIDSDDLFGLLSGTINDILPLFVMKNMSAILAGYLAKSKQ
jgi:hypothetical protein